MSDELKGFSFKLLDDELLQPTNLKPFTTPIVNELRLGNGSLKFSDGKFLFEGDAEESAKVFLEFLNQNHMGKVAQLEQEVKDLQEQREVDFDIIANLFVDCFGKDPISCDGALIMSTDKYNKLVKGLNQLNKESK